MAAPQAIKEIPLGKLCEQVGGRLQGDPATPIRGICPLDDQAAGCIAFTRDITPANLERAFSGFKASAFLVPESAQHPVQAKGLNIVFVKDPYAALMALVPLFNPPVVFQSGVSSKAEVDPSARLGKNVSVAAFCVIGARVQIGDNSTIHPNVTIYPDAQIGANCMVHAGAVVREGSHIGNDSTIQSGAVIGSDGFGYVPHDGGLKAIPQVGSVVLADRVDVGANSCIDRATLGKTSIDQGTKIDNLVQVGHNVRIGRDCVFCAQVGIAGSSTIGDRVTLAGNAGVADHLNVPSDVRVGAKSAVVRSIMEKGDYNGHPSIPAATWRRATLALPKLPDVFKRLRALEKALEKNRDEE